MPLSDRTRNPRIRSSSTSILLIASQWNKRSPSMFQVEDENSTEIGKGPGADQLGYTR